MPLNPVAAQINELVMSARADAPPPTVALMREGWETLIGQVATESTSCDVQPIDVAGMPSLSFTPAEPNGSLLVWFHGGGWVIGSPSLAVNEVDRLCAASGCRGISVGYRLAPEHPFPGPQLDAIAAASWCIERADALGIDPRRVAVGGDSAGGNLAAVAAQRVAGLAAQVLVYPSCDQRESWRATAPHQGGYILEAASIQWFLDQSRGKVEFEDPIVSPLLASDDVLREVPPACIITAEYDPLRADGATYARRLRDLGVHVEEAHFEEEMHAFFSMTEVLEDARLAAAIAAAFLVAQLGPG